MPGKTKTAVLEHEFVIYLTARKKRNNRSGLLRFKILK